MEFYGLCAPGKIGDCYKSWEAAGAKFFRGSYSEQAGAFKDRNVDGTFTFLALPGASITEASVGRDLKLLAFPKPLIDHLSKFGMGAGTIPPGTYPRPPTATRRWRRRPWARPSRSTPRCPTTRRT